MASFKGKFDSVRQDWETPKELFDAVNSEFHFTLDVAASAKNKKVGKFLSAEQDAMSVSWGTNICWLNPPYGKGYKLSAWVKKAYTESLTGATTVMLIPARTNTNWFHDYCLKYGEVRFVRGRPKFGDADHGLPQPLCFIIFRGSPEPIALASEPVEHFQYTCPKCGGSGKGDGIGVYARCGDCKGSETLTGVRQSTPAAPSRALSMDTRSGNRCRERSMVGHTRGKSSSCKVAN